jgi:EAL domain-containing protein (putative c-di-GMP-specific phosphodiesterase class I)
MFEGLERTTYRPGDLIFHEGSDGGCAYLVESGRVEISMIRENRRFKLCELGEGELFGEMALLDKKPRTATATALEETQLVCVDHEWISSKLDDVDPSIEHLLLLILKRSRDTLKLLKQNDWLIPDATDKELDKTFSETRQKLIRDIRIASDIKEALKRDEFQLYYQPIIAIKDERLAGFEALIRWRHPEYGLMQPMQFLDVAEDTKQILPVGIWIVERACHDLNELSREHHKISRSSSPLFVSINLSANQLDNAEHMAQLANIVHRTGIEPACIKWEVTETVLIDELEQAQQILTTFRDQRFRVSLDDFGTGYSSLSHLQKFPVDDIKIDGSFISRMLSDHSSMQIVKASIDLAKALDLEIVAEGVESKEEVEQLINMGSSYCQGYYYAKPLPLPEAVEYIRHNH